MLLDNKRNELATHPTAWVKPTVLTVPERRLTLKRT